MKKEVITLEVNGLKLYGAYGREANLKDWLEGLDFRILGGPYCSIRDVPTMAKQFDVLEFISRNGEIIHTEIISEDLIELMGGGKRCLH